MSGDRFEKRKKHAVTTAVNGRIRYPLSGVILAGGRNRRFGGKQKALIRIDGKTILERIAELFRDLFAEIILVANEPQCYSEWPFALVSDRFPVRSSLTGIHAALYHAGYPYVFIAACDTPFLQRGLVETVLRHVDAVDADVVVPETAAGLEPLCALYSKRCLAPVERALEAQRYKVQDVFQNLRIKKVPEPVLRRADSRLLSFININSPADLALLPSVEQRHRG